MSKTRYAFLLIILLAGIALVTVLYKQKSKVASGLTFSPAFQLLGKPTSAFNRALTRILPINKLDEKRYGDAIAESYLAAADVKNVDYIYLNSLIKNLSVFSKKEFNYRVFLISTSSPNAFALPGGIICVTTGLMETLKSEAELVSILSHEMGHIERGHCFEAIKYELAFKKIKAASVGQLADLSINLFLRHSFSKTHENSADEYGYELLLLTKYDPMGFSNAFKELQKEEGNRKTSNTIITDYFDTHPPLALRIQKFGQMATQWWLDHKNDDKRYVGVKNFNQRIPLNEHSFANEWIEDCAPI